MISSRSAAGAALLALMSLAPAAQADPPVATARAAAGPSSAAYVTPDLSGLWVQRQDTTTLSRVATIGRVRATTTSIVLFDLRHENGEIAGSGLVCDIRIDSGTSFVDTIIPDAFLTALPTPQLSAAVSESNGVLRLEQPRTWSVLGAQLEEPMTEALPTESTDPRVRDTDADGQPGVTVRVEGIVSGDVYVVQRGWSRFSGTFDDPDLATGEVEFGQDQVVLDASRRVLRTQPPTEPDTTPGANTFSLRRLPAGAGCREAVEAALRAGR